MLRIAAIAITAALLLTGCGATTPESDDTGKTTSEVPKTRSGGGAVG